MRLSDVLSKPPNKEYVQIDAFLSNRSGKTGQKVDISVGRIALNYFCSSCDDIRTFFSGEKLTCIFASKNLISIDCVLTCVCGAVIPVWFLVESKNDITGQAPEVRILKKTVKLSEEVRATHTRYGEFTTLLDKAMQAYTDGLGAGAVVYLRKIFEKITIKTAKAVDIKYPQYEGGNPKNFSDLLKKVDEKCAIIPKEFSANGYKLFQELSSIVHGEYDEEAGLSNFEALHRLVIGILENVINHRELLDAIAVLGWNEERSEDK